MTFNEYDFRSMLRHIASIDGGYKVRKRPHMDVGFILLAIKYMLIYDTGMEISQNICHHYPCDSCQLRRKNRIKIFKTSLMKEIANKISCKEILSRATIARLVIACRMEDEAYVYIVKMGPQAIRGAIAMLKELQDAKSKADLNAFTKN